MQLFNRAKWGALCGVVIGMGMLYGYTCLLHPEDPEVYRILMEGEAERAASKKVLTARPAYQMRKGVQKDIWTLSGNERLHFHLKSDQSLLTFVQHKKRFEATEELEGIDCWMQEEVHAEGGFQKVRHLVAEKGTYFFPSHRFETERVQMFFFRLPGRELPCGGLPVEAPYLTGVASQARFAAARHLPMFTAEHLRAHFTQAEEGVP